MGRAGLALAAAIAMSCAGDRTPADSCDAWSDQHAIAIHLHRAGRGGLPRTAEAVSVLGGAPASLRHALDLGALRGETLRRGDQVVIGRPAGRAEDLEDGVADGGDPLAANVFDLAPELTGPTTFQLARGEQTVRLQANLEPGVRYWLSATQLDPTLPFVCHSVAVCETGGCPRAAPPCCDAQRSRSEFIVTKGHVRIDGDWFAIDHPKVRAHLRVATAESAELTFRYRGDTDTIARLYSGGTPRQVGFMLRAHDTCNVGYVMWRIDPQPQIAVSVKRNPGEESHAECLANGYQPLDGAFEALPPPVEPGTTHAFALALDGSELRVHADYTLVWSGQIRDLPSTGRLGIRSDNARLRWRMQVSEADPPP